MPTISGTVTDSAGLPAPGRTVRAYRRDTGALLAEVLTANAVAGDANYASVSLLLHMEGAAAGVVFTDSSASPKTLTPGGQTNTSATAPMFGSTSAYFDGAGDFIDVASNAALTLGTGDFTAEGFIKPDSIASGVAAYILDMRATSASSVGVVLVQLNGDLRYHTGGNTRINAPGVLGVGWQHIAICRSGTTSRLFVGGVEVGWAADAINNTASIARLGAQVSTAASPYAGYMDEWRITKGVARYTANFTAPAAPFPETAGSPGGNYSITDAYTGEVNVICLDDAAGVNFNDLILRTTPV